MKVTITVPENECEAFAVLWSKTANFRGAWHNVNMQPLHEGAFWANFVRISTIKQNIDIFGNFLGKLDQIPEDFCYYLLLFEIFSLKV